VEQALYAYVLVNLRPMYPGTAADDLEMSLIVGIHLFIAATAFIVSQRPS
jgi:hypothetical protein